MCIICSYLVFNIRMLTFFLFSLFSRSHTDMEPLSRGRLMVALSQNNMHRETDTKRRISSPSTPNPKPTKIKRTDEMENIAIVSAMASEIIELLGQILDTSIHSLFLDPDVSFTDIGDKLNTSSDGESLQTILALPEATID